MYGVDVSHTLISEVTQSVLEEVESWQKRPLESVYPVLYLDCISVKVHQDKRVVSKSVYLALGITLDGHKELLGMWISENEGSKFWMGILDELKGRGVKDILIACVDGLSGFPEAIHAVYPQTKVQAVHRASDSQFTELCFVQRAQGGCRRLKENIYFPYGAGSRGGVRALQGKVGSSIRWY